MYVFNEADFYEMYFGMKKHQISKDLSITLSSEDRHLFYGDSYPPYNVVTITNDDKRSPGIEIFHYCVVWQILVTTIALMESE
jgi:hypothetical protein